MWSYFRMPQRTNEEFEMTESVSQITLTSARTWRTLIAFWVLGLCNNYGYVVMLSAAKDIIAQQQTEAVIFPTLVLEING